MTWSAPATFDEDELVGPIARGKSGLVYVARDMLLERHVAVKCVAAPDTERLHQFLGEARAAARIQHPNVATLYRVGQLDDAAAMRRRSTCC